MCYEVKYVEDYEVSKDIGIVVYNGYNYGIFEINKVWWLCLGYKLSILKFFLL